MSLAQLRRLLRTAALFRYVLTLLALPPCRASILYLSQIVKSRTYAYIFNNHKGVFAKQACSFTCGVNVPCIIENDVRRTDL